MMFGSGEEMRILIPPASPDTAATSAGGGGGGGGGRGKEERVPQWGQQETRDFIGIRGELERDFTVSKRNKTLWEVVAARMGERGYRRSPGQCKCKWKNLVNRYKGQETSDLDNGRHCPFFDELHAVFTERARNMQQLLLESETGAPSPSKKKLKRSGGDKDKSSDELSDDDDGEDDDSIDEQQSTRTRKKPDKVQQRVADKSKAANVSLHELLQDFFQQQQRSDAQWQEIMERRVMEQRVVEQEWRQSMEKLERERLMLERAWQEREEHRRIREESRAAKRDALLTTLLNKLIQGDL